MLKLKFTSVLFLVFLIPVPLWSQTPTGWAEDRLSSKVKVKTEETLSLSLPGSPVPKDILTTTYDNQGRWVEKLLKDASGAIVFRQSFPQGDRGEVLGSDSGDSYGRLSERVRYTRDSKGRIITETRTDPEDNILDLVEITYSPQGLKTELTAKTPEGQNLWRIRYAYDQQGRVVSGSRFEGRNEVERQFWKWDPQNNPVEILIKTPGPRGTWVSTTLVRITYQYWN